MNTNDTKKRELQDKAREIQINDVLTFIGHNWYWFLISFVACIALAAIYIRTQPRVYTRTVSVLIKDEGKGGVSESDAFNDFNILNMASNITNEQYIFKSRRLLQNVVKQLRLDVTYKTKGRFQTVDLYKSTPIMLHIVGETESQAIAQSFAITVTPLSDKKIRIQPAETDYEDWQIEAAFNDTIDTPYGKLMITPTMSFSYQFLEVPIYVTKNNMPTMANAISTGLRVALPDQNSTIVNLSIADVSITRAEDILNTLITVYNDDANNDKNLIALNTSNFIDERLVIIEAELGSVDSNIEDYKRQNRLTDISSETGMYLQSTSQYQQQSLALENQLLIAKSIQDYLRDNSKEKELIPTNTGVFDAGIERQINEYNEMMLQRNRLSTNENDRNPVVINLNNSLNALRQTIILTVDNLVAGLQGRIQNTRVQAAQTSHRISQVPTQQKYVLSVERQQKIKESLYLYLLNKREEIALTQSIRENKAKLVDTAYGTNIPVSPNTNLILLIALTFSFLLPGLFLWLLNALDTKVRGGKDVELLVSVPYLGEIPFRKNLPSNTSLAVTKDGKDGITKAFRTVRANLLFSPERTSGQVILITSTEAKAGKTFVASNLAASLSFSGKKILFIDFDTCKKPSSSKKGNNNTIPGLSDYLSGNVTEIESIIIPGSDEEKPDQIGTGTLSLYSEETVFGENSSRLLDELKKRYDYIIIDSFSFNHDAESMFVNRLADMTLCIVRYGQAGQRSLVGIEELVTKGKLHNTLIILNGTKHNAFRFEYAFY